jgi:hypothetical protein
MTGPELISPGMSGGSAPDPAIAALLAFRRYSLIVPQLTF